jgi:hypothetical protein
MQVNSEIPMAFHCIIHHEALRCRISSLKDVMKLLFQHETTFHSTVWNIANCRIFWKKKIETEYGSVVYYSAVRWLSRGSVLKSCLYLRLEVGIFMWEKDRTVLQLSCVKWIADLNFLVHETNLQELNVKLKRKGKLLLDVFWCQSFRNKITLLHIHVKEQIFYHLPFSKLLCNLSLDHFNSQCWKYIR